MGDGMEWDDIDLVTGRERAGRGCTKSYFWGPDIDGPSSLLAICCTSAGGSHQQRSVVRVLRPVWVKGG